MRLAIVLIVSVGLVNGACADDKKDMDAIKELEKYNEDIITLFGAIIDKPTAKSKLTKIHDLEHKLVNAEESIRKIAMSNPSAEVAKMLESAQKRQSQLENRLELEYNRIDRIPAAYDIVKDISIFKKLKRDRDEMALGGVKTLTHAVELFKIKYNRFPDNLNELVGPIDGRKPLLDTKEFLTDPWGRVYQYDPKGPKNNGSKPDIWSLGPYHAEGIIIGNWPKK